MKCLFVLSIFNLLLCARNSVLIFFISGSHSETTVVTRFRCPHLEHRVLSFNYSATCTRHHFRQRRLQQLSIDTRFSHNHNHHHHNHHHHHHHHCRHHQYQLLLFLFAAFCQQGTFVTFSSVTKCPVRGNLSVLGRGDLPRQTECL